MFDRFSKEFRAGLHQGAGVVLVIFIALIFLLGLNSFTHVLHFDGLYFPPNETKIALTASQHESLNALIQKGYVISASDFYNNMLAFYNNLITWLIGLLGASAIIGYTYVQGVSDEKSEKHAIKAVKAHFEKIKTEKDLRELVQDAFEDNEELEALRAEFEELREQTVGLNQLRLRVGALEESAELQASSRFTPGPLTPIAPPPPPGPQSPTPPSQQERGADTEPPEAV